MNGVLAILLSVFRIVVIPVQFEDTGFTYGPEDFQSVLDKAGQYLGTQFRGTCSFEFALTSTVTLSNPTGWYGANISGIHDSRICDALTEACRALDTETDFSSFDGNQDETVDCVALLTAGLSESDGAPEECIWPQQGRLSERRISLALDGKTIDPFIVFTELKSTYGEAPCLTGIGDLCHEILHIFGLPDFYDTDGETNGLGKGLWGSTAIMDRGNRNDNGQTPPNLSAVEMHFLGLGTCDTLECGQYTLSPIGKDGRYLKMLSSKEDEYLLLECRKAEGWDRFIGGEGLLAYHVDRSLPDYKAFWDNNKVNADSTRQGACILAADPEADEVSKLFFPRPGRTAITSDTTPSTTFHGGEFSRFAITGIRRTGDGSVAFEVSEPVIINDITTFQDAATVNWTLAENADPRSVSVSWYLDGELIGSKEVPGADCCSIEGLEPKTQYEARVTVLTKSGDRCSDRIQFKTKAFINGIKPYIYLRSADRNEDGSFICGARIPLRIFNADDAESIEWSFDSYPVKTGADGFFKIERDGRLKARILHSDGSVSVMIKDITVK